MTTPETSDYIPELTYALREFSKVFVPLRQPRWQEIFAELAASFEKVETYEQQSRLAEQGLAYFDEPGGLNDMLQWLKGMPDAELYRILEASWMFTREVLKRHL